MLTPLTDRTVAPFSRASNSAPFSVRLTIFEPTEAYFIHGRVGWNHCPTCPPITDIDIVDSVAVQRSAASRDCARLDSVRTVEVGVIQADTYGILEIAAPVELGESGFLICSSRNYAEESGKQGIDRRTLSGCGRRGAGTATDPLLILNCRRTDDAGG